MYCFACLLLERYRRKKIYILIPCLNLLSASIVLSTNITYCVVLEYSTVQLYLTVYVLFCWSGGNGEHAGEFSAESAIVLNKRKRKEKLLLLMTFLL